VFFFLVQGLEGFEFLPLSFSMRSAFFSRGSILRAGFELPFSLLLKELLLPFRENSFFVAARFFSRSRPICFWLRSWILLLPLPPSFGGIGMIPFLCGWWPLQRGRIKSVRFFFFFFAAKSSFFPLASRVVFRAYYEPTLLLFFFFFDWCFGFPLAHISGPCLAAPSPPFFFFPLSS